MKKILYHKGARNDVQEQGQLQNIKSGLLRQLLASAASQEVSLLSRPPRYLSNRYLSDSNSVGVVSGGGSSHAPAVPCTRGGRAAGPPILWGCA